MCPLRVILIFLSATLAGFFLIRNNINTNKSNKQQQQLPYDKLIDSTDPISSHSKVRGVIETGFWTCVDMASGRYLWRNIVTSTPSPKRST